MTREDPEFERGQARAKSGLWSALEIASTTHMIQRIEASSPHFPLEWHDSRSPKGATRERGGESGSGALLREPAYSWVCNDSGKDASCARE